MVWKFPLVGEVTYTQPTFDWVTVNWYTLFVPVTTVHGPVPSWNANQIGCDVAAQFEKLTTAFPLPPPPEAVTFTVITTVWSLEKPLADP